MRGGAAGRTFILILFLTSPILLFWGGAEWSSRRTLARATRAFEEVAGPQEGWGERLRPSTLNAAARELVVAMRPTGLHLLGYPASQRAVYPVRVELTPP